MFGKSLRLLILLSILYLFTSSCANLQTNTDFYGPIMQDVSLGQYASAVKKVEKARKEKIYLEKDRVLYYLDKGALLHYQGQYTASNEALERADRGMEELFTKSIGKSAASFMLNDNVLDYYGEIYENIYVNIFKALNFINLGDLNSAYVEIKRINEKLLLLDDKYGKMVNELNKSGENKISIEKKALRFYDDVLAHYLSYLIFMADREPDNARISFEKITQAWQSQPEVYTFIKPDFLGSFQESQGNKLRVMAFVGNAPRKQPVGAKITTYENLITVTDLGNFLPDHQMIFPGVKEGWHFKFAFPAIKARGTSIARVMVKANGQPVGELQQLEDISKVAINTFETKKNIIYFKTLARTVAKGILAAEAKARLKKEMKTNDLMGALMDAAVDAGVDATENPDLRTSRMFPHACLIGEFSLEPGIYHIEIEFINTNGLLVQKKDFPGFRVDQRLNLIETVSLN